VLLVGLLRLFQSDFPALAVDPDAIAQQTQKLRRLIPTGLLNELKPFALAVNAATFDHRALSRGLATAGLRAGVVTAGSVGVALRVAMARAQVADLPTAMTDPVLRELVQFAIGEDHAALAGLGLVTGL